MNDRRQESYAVRLEAAELARSRTHPPHQANGDEQRFAGENYFMSFTKGLPHNPDTGLLQDPRDFVEFRRAIDDGFIDPFTERVRHGAKYIVALDGARYIVKPDPCPTDDFRQWEAPTAGVAFELEGPDAQAVTMPPAPPLLGTDGKVNPELVFEMAEVYELAVLRDVPFNALENGARTPEVDAAVDRLKLLPYLGNQTGRPRKVGSGGDLDAQTAFRGSSPGVEVGPYLSQFLLIGNTDLGSTPDSPKGSVKDGKILYGVLEIDQRVPIALEEADFMTTMEEYVKVQRGIKPEVGETYEPGEKVCSDATARNKRRFISTPRDLATYVHFDALYEAYLNACIILLGMATPFDPGFDHLSGVGAAAGSATTRRHAGGFALYGGPHVLTLVTEVATRALKAVRFQKFNSHIRLRPEALAARVELARIASGLPQAAQDSIPAGLLGPVNAFRNALDSNGGAVSTLGAIANGPGKGTNFLPMAFAEGSPMHPAYGAGHATVAGACVTMLKAFFDTSAVLVKSPDGSVAFKRMAPDDCGVVYRAPAIGDTSNCLAETMVDAPLTLEGELNKLAANISIGRNMAGVHYFSDYYDSLRMGEAIAIGILEEQALTYSTDPFVLSVPTFDGDVVRIGRR